MTRSSGLVVLCLALGCRPGASNEPTEVGPPLPNVDRDDPAFAGTWVGPEFMLSFVGEWVLIRPSEDPEVAPIELRVTIERAEGDAYALQTSLAGALAADFLRAPDWTLLVEDGQLALAMGDEPLAAYLSMPDAPAMLRGPDMFAEVRFPEELRMADAIACLEVAGDRLQRARGRRPGCDGVSRAAMGHLRRADRAAAGGPGRARGVDRCGADPVAHVGAAVLRGDGGWGSRGRADARRKPANAGAFAGSRDGRRVAARWGRYRRPIPHLAELLSRSAR